MNIKEEDFPIYKLLKDNKTINPDTIAEFEKAQRGSDEDKFQFAFDVQTAVVPENREMFGDTPGSTEDMNQKTLASCIAVFKDVASRGHKMGAWMLADYERRGLLNRGSAPVARSQKQKIPRP